MDFLIYTIILLPIVFSILIFNPFISNEEKTVRTLAKTSCTISLLLLVYQCIIFDFSQPDYIIEVGRKWIITLGINFIFTIDTLSLLYAVLCSFIIFITIHISKKAIKYYYKLYYALLLIIQSASIGMLFARDIFLFFMFLQLSIFAFFILVSKYCNINNKLSSYKFMLYKYLATMFILIGFIFIYFLNFKYTGTLSADINDIDISLYSENARTFLFICIFLGLYLNFPMLPFHRFSLEINTDAISPLSIIYTSVFFITSGWGILKYILYLFHSDLSQYYYLIILISAISILYISICMAKENNLKKLISYTFFINCGLFLAGIFSSTKEGIIGSIYLLFSYPLIITGLYIITDCIYRETGTNNIKRLNGLSGKMYYLAFFSILFICSYIGIPLFSGFLSIFLPLEGIFITDLPHIISLKFTTIIIIISLLLAGTNIVYVFWKIFLGTQTNNKRKINDIKAKQAAILTIIILIIIFIGLFPSVLTDIISEYTNNNYNIIGEY